MKKLLMMTVAAVTVVTGVLNTWAETLNVERDAVLTTNAVYDSVNVSENATLNLNGRKLSTGAISGGGTVMSAAIDESRHRRKPVRIRLYSPWIRTVARQQHNSPRRYALQAALH